MNDKLYKKISEDFIKRGEIILNDCEFIEDENNILYVIKKKDNNWFFSLGLDRLYVGFNYWYFRPSIQLYGFDGEQTNEVLLTILKIKLKKYVTNETMDIIKSLVEWDLQPSFTEYEYIDKILKKNSND
jgi:hypothetical protein